MTEDVDVQPDGAAQPGPAPARVDTPAPAAPHTGQPAVDEALARFVERLPEGLDTQVEAGARLDEALRAQLTDLDPGGRA